MPLFFTAIYLFDERDEARVVERRLVFTVRWLGMHVESFRCFDIVELNRSDVRPPVFSPIRWRNQTHSIQLLFGWYVSRRLFVKPFEFSLDYLKSFIVEIIYLILASIRFFTAIRSLRSLPINFSIKAINSVL